MAAKGKDVVRKVQEAWNAGKLDQLDQYFSPDFASESGIPGLPPTLDSAKMAHGMFRQAFTDANVEILDLVGDGDTIVLRTRTSGTNTGGAPFYGVGPNNAKIDFQSVSIYTLKGGKIVHHAGVNDGATLLAQLGAWTPPAMPG